jgi:hypothetical protein
MGGAPNQAHVTAGDLPADDDAMRELARLRSPVLVYLLDAGFQITFSSDGTPPGPLPAEVDEAVHEMRASLDAGEPAAAVLPGSRIVRVERLIGESAETAYVVFIELVGKPTES